MSRTFTADAVNQVNKSQTGACFLAIMVIDHPDMDDPIRVVNNNQDVVYDGNTYYKYPFKFEPPKDIEGEIASARITIDNVARDIITTLRSISTPATVDAAIIMVSSSGVVTKEAGWWSCVLRNVKYDAMSITGDIAMDAQVGTMASRTTYNPFDFPALYA